MFICAPMERELPPAELDRIRAALRRLETAHAELMAALHAPVDSSQEPGENGPQ